MSAILPQIQMSLGGDIKDPEQEQNVEKGGGLTTSSLDDHGKCESTGG